RSPPTPPIPAPVRAARRRSSAQGRGCRTCLCLQASGFEGFGIVPKGVDENGPAVSKCGNGGELNVDCRPSPYSVRDLLRDPSVLRVDDADQLQCDRIPKWFADPLPLAHDRVTTHDRSRLRPTLQFAPNDHVRIERLTHGLDVPSVDGHEA